LFAGGLQGFAGVCGRVQGVLGISGGFVLPRQRNDS
jgi:hypothetical protein